MRVTTLPSALLASALTVLSANAAPGPAVPLWPDGAPGALGDGENDRPTLTPYLVGGDGPGPVAALVVCPGGGYCGLAPHEGGAYSACFQERGLSEYAIANRHC